MSSRHDRPVVGIPGPPKTLVEGERPTVLQRATRFKIHRETVHRAFTPSRLSVTPSLVTSRGACRTRGPRLRYGRHSRPLRTRAHDP